MKRLILLGALLIGASLSAGCSRKPPAQLPASAPEALVTTVTPQAVPVVKEGVATLDGWVNATITARVSSHIISQIYHEGSVVKKGDLLSQIDPRPFEDALAQARANLARAQATRLKAEQDEKRELELLKNRVISAQERDSALQGDATAKAATEADRAAFLDLGERTLLRAERAGLHLVFGCDRGFCRRSVGYVGASDGWTDLHKGNFQLDWEYQEAGPGNVVLTGEVDLAGTGDRNSPDAASAEGGHGAEFILGVGFGDSIISAAAKLFQAFAIPFERHRTTYVA
jgi:hypothetical protein